MRCLTILALLVLWPHGYVFGQGNPGSNLPSLSPLTLTVSGDGTVAPNLNNRLLRVGALYTVTARPAAGFVFSNWTGVTLETNPRLTFVMQSNLVLQANFVPSPFVAARGRYTGLFHEDAAPAYPSSGLITGTLTESGMLSARLVLAGKAYSLKGQFTAGGYFSNNIPRRGLSPLSVQLQLDLAAADQMTGHVSDGTFTSPVVANRAVFAQVTNPAPPGGKKYTLVLSPNESSALIPGGHGFAAMSVDLAGNVKLSGTLADGTKFSSATFVAKDGRWPLFSSVSAGKNLVLGELTFANDANSDLSGQLSWFKLPQPAAKYYPAGFALTNSLAAVGSLHSFTPGVRLLVLTNDGGVILENGNLPQNITNHFDLDANNRVIGRNGLSVKIKPTTGLFSGRTLDPATKRPLAFSGALLQKQNAGFGYFANENQTGGVFLGPTNDTSLPPPPPPPPPVANFNAHPTHGEPPLMVSFVNLSQHATNYSWTFGDGTQSSLAQPSHTYTAAGTYSVTLAAIGAGGADAITRTDYIVVTNAPPPPPPPPVAGFRGSPTSGEAPLTVVFANLSQQATSYFWGFGDGHESALEQPTHTYTAAGTYSVTLAAVGAGGTNAHTEAGYIVVTNALPPPPPGTNLPSQVLNLTAWKLTLPVDTSHAGNPDEIRQPELDRFRDSAYFDVNGGQDGVVFTAPCGGATTSGSGYPRSELREMTSDGTTEASWSTTSGVHTMEITEAITHLPAVKPHVVAGQIHDANDDVIVFRLEGSELFVDENGNHGPVLDADYRLGDRFTVKFVARNGGVEVYYNNQYIYTYPVNTAGCYFKAGCYTQSNTSRGDDAAAYGQVVIYRVTMTHQ